MLVLALSWLPRARRRYPNRQLKTQIWTCGCSRVHSRILYHSLKRFFWRRPIVINHFGGKVASPALPSAPPSTEAPRVPSSPESAGLQDRIVDSVERRRRTQSVLTHYKAGIPPLCNELTTALRCYVSGHT